MATAHEWQQQILAWQASGLTQAAYCRQHGLNLHTFKGWQRRVTGASARTPGLLPIQVAAVIPAPASTLVLRLAAGHALELPAATGAKRREKLSRVLGKSALKSCHPRSFNARLLAGVTWSDQSGTHCRTAAPAFC